MQRYESLSQRPKTSITFEMPIIIRYIWMRFFYKKKKLFLLKKLFLIYLEIFLKIIKISKKSILNFLIKIEKSSFSKKKSVFNFFSYIKKFSFIIIFFKVETNTPLIFTIDKKN